MSGERKRPNVFGEDSEQGAAGSPKRPRNSQQGAPSFLPPKQQPAMPPSSLPPPPPPAADISALVAAKRAEVQAKLAAMRSKMMNGGAAPPATAPPPPPPAGRSTLPPVPGLPKPNLDPDLARKVADAKKLVESFQARSRAAAMPANPYLPLAAPKKNDPTMDPALAGRGGLAMAAHPLLMETATPTAQSKKERYKPMVPKFSTTKANARLPPPPPKPAPAPATPALESIADTPYFDSRLSYGTAGVAAKSHMGRGHARETLKFNQKGKFVRLGESMRQEAKMEELKKRILESAKKAGLESEMEDQAKVIKRPAPPDIEWWDAPFLPEKSYDSFSPEYLDKTDSITIYIQHPIQIPAPQDKIKVKAKPLFLTKKELKKMRRQRRAAALRDKQDRVKMGLLPPPPPKVKLSNMMRVLTQDAIADPTKIEAQVRREMVAREKQHLKANAERKLTPDQRHEKIEAKKAKDEALGIGAMCYKVRYLSDPAHKSKVRNNAAQDNLTGVIIYNPKFCLVVVEGGAKGLKHFKNLMLRRIDWTQEARARAGDVAEVDEAPPAPEGDADASSSLAAMEGLEAPPSLADNTCTLVWEGHHRERMFRRFGQANCPSDANAKEALGAKLEGLWDVAKVEVKEED